MALPARLTGRWAASKRPLSLRGQLPHARNLCPQRRWLSRAHLESSRVQVYVSRTQDPYVNLSIEHYLLERSHPDSVVLLLYTNRPCVVIGRNQNPWLEVNLGQLRRGLTPAPPPGRREDDEHGAPRREDDDVLLVRRRSGGGTVFHDEGNANYCVIVPRAGFHRDTSAEMVARALRGLGVRGVRVSERHDIVMDVTPPAASSRTAGDEDGDGDGDAERPSTFKISGSAFKITRERALHHGTCLLSSPHVGRGGAMSRLLRSPAEPFIRARGVASVRSPVRNVGGGIAGRDFERAVADEFTRMWHTHHHHHHHGDAAPEVVQETVGLEEAMARPQIVAGRQELMTRDWIFGQTPRFTFSTYPTETDEREKPALPSSIPEGFKANLNIHQGQITDARFEGLHADAASSLIDKSILNIANWGQELHLTASGAIHPALGSWFNSMLGVEAMQRYKPAPPKEGPRKHHERRA